MVQWLKLHTSNARMQRERVQSLVGELRSHMLCDAVQKKKKGNVGGLILSDPQIR